MAALVPDKQVQIVVYGASLKNRDVLIALEKLDRAGYESVTFLEGGLEEWPRAGYDLEGDAPDRQDDPQTKIRLADAGFPMPNSQRN